VRAMKASIRGHTGRGAPAVAVAVFAALAACGDWRWVAGPANPGAGADRAAGAAWPLAFATARLTPGRPRGTVGVRGEWGGGESDHSSAGELR